MQPKKLLLIFNLLLAVLVMVSCSDDDDSSSSKGDVLILSRKSGTETVHGISIYAYSLRPIKSVSVVSSAESGKTFNLTEGQGNFYYETPVAQFTAAKPVASTYLFTATMENGDKETFENRLTDQTLPLPTFEKCEYNAVNHQLEVKWPLINGANSYAINLLEDAKIVFRSTELRGLSSGAYAVKASGGGWSPDFTPVAGKTYTVRLFAYLYEPSGEASNIQSISMSDSNIVWGN
ncbi:MAG: hypothetical protein H7X84_07290 [Verrucomicrobia bacterium]|nr:hypothetical protein [Prolixibacteraceae bacterium]